MLLLKLFNLKILIIVLLGLMIFFVLKYFDIDFQLEPKNKIIGRQCGGYAGVECPEGYICDFTNVETPCYDCTGVCKLDN